MRKIRDGSFNVITRWSYGKICELIGAGEATIASTKGQLDGRYDDLRAGLRMNIIANPGVEKADFELWSLAVSAINGSIVSIRAAVSRKARPPGAS